MGTRFLAYKILCLNSTILAKDHIWLWDVYLLFIRKDCNGAIAMKHNII
jgi:hypothetical protein